MIEGFDASAYSGTVDWRAAYAAGKRFVWQRVGRGVPNDSTRPDGTDSRWDGGGGARAAGLMAGGYWRFDPSKSMTAQVDLFASALAQKPGMLPPLVDLEDNPAKLPAADLTGWLIGCLTAVRYRTGRTPAVYTGENFYDTQLQGHRLDRWQLVMANWAASGEWPDHSATFHQYRGDYSGAPWAGDIDLIRYAGTAADLASLGHEHGLLYVMNAGRLHGPRADWRPLPEADTQSASSNDVLVVHSMSGYLRGTDTYFRDSTGVESTWGIGGSWDGPELDGAVWQWMDADRKADANYQGSLWTASVETSDGAPADEEPGPRWTPRQAESLAQVIAAWCRAYSRPAKAVDRARPDRRGVGWHRQGVDSYPELYRAGWRQEGDTFWSKARGKTCPMTARIAQLTDEVIPRAAALVAGAAQTAQEDDMALTDDDVARVVAAIKAMDVYVPPWTKTDADPDGTSWTLRQVLASTHQYAYRVGQTYAPQILAAVGALTDDEAKILAAVAGVSSGSADVAAIVSALRETLPGDTVAALKEAL